MKNLADKTTSRYEVYKAFYEYITKNNGIPPTMRWLEAHTSLGSTNTVSHHITKLLEAGLLGRVDAEKQFPARGLYIPGSQIVVGDSYKPDAMPLAYCKVLVIDGRILTAKLAASLKAHHYHTPLLPTVVAYFEDAQTIDRAKELDSAIFLIKADIYNAIGRGPVYTLIHHILTDYDIDEPGSLSLITKDQQLTLCAIGMGCRVYDPDIEVPGWDDGGVQS